MKPFKLYLCESEVNSKQSYTKNDAIKLGNSNGVDWKKVDIEQFHLGLNIEKEHDDGSQLDTVRNESDLVKIVLAHLKEKSDYYTQLKKVEEDVPVNSLSGGGIAGLNEPIVRKRIKPKRR
jgi:hypothetical protein